MSSEEFDESKGRVKEAVGSLTGNEELKADGRADQRTGKTKRAVGNVTDQAKGFVDEVAEKATAAIDKTKDAIQKN
jgi:uncharacterized protein YjbJ (UPF0337 family)